MKLIHRAAIACIAIANAATFTTANAQTATASTNITCVQSGASMTCTQQPVVFTLPANVNLANQTSGSSITLTGGTTGPVAPASCAVSPANPTVAIGGSVTLTVSCQVGSGGYTYAWTKAGNAIGGATGASYALNTTTDTGTTGTTSYSVTVTNTAGTSGASANVTVQAATPPSGCSISASATSVLTGATPTLSVSCTGGTAPFTYQWTKAGNAISNATNQSYTLSGTSDTAAAGTTLYAVNVTNTSGTASPNIQITVTANPQTTCPSGTLYYVMSSANSSYIDTNGQYGTTPVSITMDVASNNSTTGLTNLPKLWFYESPSYPESYKEVTISSSPCNFTNPEYVVSAADAFNQGGWKFLLFNDSRLATYPRLNTGRWYINVRNVEGACTGQCNTRISLVR
jgi:hypothetical protein